MILIGSLGVIVGSFLNWIDSRDQAGSPAQGFQISDGRVALDIGVALLVVGILIAATGGSAHGLMPIHSRSRFRPSRS